MSEKAKPWPGWLGWLVLLTAVCRVLFVLAFDHLALGQPDAVTYHRAAVAFMERGLLSSEIPGVPYMQGGYPVLISLVYRIGGVSARNVLVLQAILSAGTILFAWRLVARELSVPVAHVTAVLLALHPALWSLPAQLLYETVFLFLLVAGADLLSRVGRRDARAPVRNALVAGAMLGLGVAVQAKMAPVALGLLIWLFVRNRRTAIVGAAVFACLVPPVLYAGRNVVAEGEWVLSTNLGAVMFIGFNDGATGGYMNPDATGCPALEAAPDRDGVQRACALRWIVQHPLRLPELMVRKSLYFLSPLAGPLQDGPGTLGPFDLRRLLPDRMRSEAWVSELDHALRLLWTLGFVVVLAWGASRAWRLHPEGTLYLITPCLLLLGVTLVTYGDARYRVPIIPFYLPLVLLGVLDWYVRIRRSRSSASRH